MRRISHGWRRDLVRSDSSRGATEQGAAARPGATLLMVAGKSASFADEAAASRCREWPRCQAACSGGPLSRTDGRSTSCCTRSLPRCTLQPRIPRRPAPSTACRRRLGRSRQRPCTRSRLARNQQNPAHNQRPKPCPAPPHSNKRPRRSRNWRRNRGCCRRRRCSDWQRTAGLRRPLARRSRPHAAGTPRAARRACAGRPGRPSTRSPDPRGRGAATGCQDCPSQSPGPRGRSAAWAACPCASRRRAWTSPTSRASAPAPFRPGCSGRLRRTGCPAPGWSAAQRSQRPPACGTERIRIPKAGFAG
mmetsp:Transcript_18837/g.42092  ORF Transcript_18837/g.42092 Transcript_18837/m.42092 type:complete len:305 (+) Transcript_18837:853-1767(+)